MPYQNLVSTLMQEEKTHLINENKMLRDLSDALISKNKVLKRLAKELSEQLETKEK